MERREVKNRMSFIVAVILLIIIILVKVATFYPHWVEHVYSTGVYPYIAKTYRFLFGWFPMSVGDLLYLTVMVYLSVKIFHLFKILRHRRWDLLKIKTGYARPFFTLAIIYILFNLAWGLNYNRLGIAYQLQLQPKQHTVQDLQMVTSALVKSLNEKRSTLGANINFYKYKQVFQKSQQAYKKAAERYPFFTYEVESIKRSIYGRAGIYLGFLGYYNPFTGESQLNLTQPRFLLPFVTCHEMAHQLGYASESEANFVGYLVAVNSGDPIFQYSAYFDIFNYANRELSRLDTALARQNLLQLDTLVRKDITEVKEYYKKSDNIMETVVRTFYDQYLKANQQTEGVRSYNEVVGWLVAYYKKFGRV